MVFTAIIRVQLDSSRKMAVTCIADNFDDAKKKLLSIYGKKLVSIIYEADKN